MIILYSSQSFASIISFLALLRKKKLICVHVYVYVCMCTVFCQNIRIMIGMGKKKCWDSSAHNFHMCHPKFNLISYYMKMQEKQNKHLDYAIIPAVNNISAQKEILLLVLFYFYLKTAFRNYQILYLEHTYLLLE